MSRVRLDTLREEVVSMRARMRRELDRSEAGRFDLKHGRGGIGDIEFVVQYLVLRNARNYPAVIRFSDNIRQIAALAAAGRCLPGVQAAPASSHPQRPATFCRR
jgi:glutamate-ammonia-ligase adenylyltransferase